MRAKKFFRASIPLKEMATRPKNTAVHPPVRRNVLHLVENLRMGGLENVIKHLALAQMDGISQQVCVLDKIGSCAEELRDSGILLHHLDRSVNRTRFPDVIRQLKGIIRTQAIGILHSHDLSSWLPGVTAGRATGTKIVFTKHGQLENPRIKDIALIKLLSALTDKIIAVSEQVKTDLVARQYVNQRKTSVILNGVALERFAHGMPKAEAKTRLGIDEASFVVGTITRFYPVKNIEMQLEMAAALSPRIPGFRHLIAAPMANEYGRQIADEVARRGLGASVQLLGFRKDIPELLRAMDVFLLTSFSEGTSLALLEAMASGCAVVATRVGGNVSLVRHGVNGLLFDVNELPELLSHMQFLHENPVIRDTLGNAAQTEAQRFSLSSMIEGYFKVYSQIWDR